MRSQKKGRSKATNATHKLKAREASDFDLYLGSHSPPPSPPHDNHTQLELVPGRLLLPLLLLRVLVPATSLASSRLYAATLRWLLLAIYSSSLPLSTRNNRPHNTNAAYKNNKKKTARTSAFPAPRLPPLPPPRPRPPPHPSPRGGLLPPCPNA